MSARAGPHHAADADLPTQIAAVVGLVSASPTVDSLLDRVATLDLPGWYLGAGAIAQTVWNAQHGFDPAHGIKDYDVVYFDDGDRSRSAEEGVTRRVVDVLSDLAVAVDVTNEARVHEWYEQRFGRALVPYTSTEQAIATWPTTATAIGVRRERGRDVVCAPFGLRDLLALVVRPNRTLVDERVYVDKTRRWRARWPRLTVIEW